MLTIQFITSMGASLTIEVRQFHVLKRCKYRKCRVEFPTVDPDQKYCKPSHCVRESEERRFDRETQEVPA